MLKAHRHYLRAQKSSVKRECPLKELACEPMYDPGRPEAAEDEWDRLIGAVPPHLRVALVLLREGYTIHAAAAALDQPDRSLERDLAGLRRAR